MDMIWEGFKDELERMSEQLMRDVLNYFESIESKPTGRDTVSDIDVDYIVDTCWVSDIDCYETAIEVRFKDGKVILPWVVVEYYSTEEEAQLGHKTWVEYVEDESPTFFHSVQTKNIHGFMRGDNR